MAVGPFPCTSDPTLLSEIRQYGHFDTTGCYQCGSCTLTCELVSDSASFPRKSIRYALLGLRQPLLSSLEPWICHDCGDCSVVCPREAEPRISMLTLRRFLSAEYEWTGVGSKLLKSKSWYFGSLCSVAILTFLLILAYHLWYVGMGAKDFATTPFGLEHMFPIITYYTLVVVLLPLLLLLSRIARIWRLTMAGENIGWTLYARQAWVYVYQSAAQSLMRKCPEHRRWFGHEALAMGTVTMLVIKVFGLRWFQTDNVYPFYNPQRWLGYLAAGLILYGIGDLLVGRFRAHQEIYKETHFHDLVFPILIISTVLTGLLAHILRYAGFALACHYAYALHVMVATPMLVIEMSFGKWAHMVYRPLALYFHAVKERAATQAPAGEAVSDAI